MRHAILVMGHGNLNIMKKYMEILDDERFDFYIYIDKKSKDDGQWLAGGCKKSKVRFRWMCWQISSLSASSI